MIVTEPATYAVLNPTAADVHTLGEEARAAGACVTAHPDTLAALHAAVVVYGPMIARTSLAGVLDVDVLPDPGLAPGRVVFLADDTADVRV